jgi:hypothetical protein
MEYSACPQRLKPERVGALGGTAEAVPFPFLLPYTANRDLF